MDGPNQGTSDGGAVMESNQFTISEFARLCVIMRDDEDAKGALTGTGQELTRSQLDAGFSRESYWGVIGGRFSDANLRLNLNMVGNVDDVDSTRPPPCHRSASLLKDKFLDARRSFTLRLQNWSQFGQNDNADIKRFAGTRNGELTAEGKRNMILFLCARKGTENEETRFLNLCTRVIPFGRGCDEGGTDSQAESGATGYRNRRKSKSNDSDTPFERSWVEYARIATAEKKEKAAERLEKAEKRKKEERESSRKKLLSERQWAIISMGNLYGSMKSQGLVPDGTFEECAKIQMEELRKVFMMPEQEELRHLQGHVNTEARTRNDIEPTPGTTEGSQRDESSRGVDETSEGEEDEIQPAR